MVRSAASLPELKGASSLPSASKWNNLLANKLNLCYTALIFINHFAYGITVTIIGATLVDLRFIYGVSLDTVSYIPIAVSIGYLLGSLAGWLYKWLNRQLMLILLIFIWSLTVTLVPFYPTFWIALVALVLNGIGDGSYDAASSVWLCEMFPGSWNTGMLSASQFMYGAGTIVAPLLVAPFVYGEALVDSHNVTLTKESRIAGLAVPFEISGGIQAIAPFFLLILYCIRPYKNTLPKSASATSDLVSKDDPESPSPSPTKLSLHTIPHRNAKLTLCGLCIAIYASAEFGYFSYSVAMYQYLAVPLSAADSALVMSILTSSFTLGRLLTAFIGIKLSPETIITYHYGILLVGLTIITFGHTHMGLVYFGTALLGYGYSAMWAALFAFTSKFLILTDRVSASFSFLFGITFLIIPFVMTHLFERFPLVLLVMQYIFILVSLVIFGVMRCWIRKPAMEFLNEK